MIDCPQFLTAVDLDCTRHEVFVLLLYCIVNIPLQLYGVLLRSSFYLGARFAYPYDLMTVQSPIFRIQGSPAHWDNYVGTGRSTDLKSEIHLFLDSVP